MPKFQAHLIDEFQIHEFLMKKIIAKSKCHAKVQNTFESTNFNSRIFDEKKIAKLKCHAKIQNTFELTNFNITIF